VKRWAVALLLAALWLCARPGRADAQDPRLRGRLSAHALAEVTALVDSARAAGLPTEPLVAKALEGASKRADGPRIVASVRTLAARLGTARQALGRGASEAELTSAAAALYLGVGTDALRRVQAGSRGRPLAPAYVALAFLVQQGVPADASTRIVTRLVEARATEGDFAVLQRQVAADVGAGAAPAAAAATRARGLVIGRGSADGVAPRPLVEPGP
jgi:hypothetical protein